MSQVKIMNSLKDIINIKCDEFSDKVAFLEKSKETRKFETIKYSQVKEDVNALGTVMLEKLKLEDKKVAVIGENSYKWYVTYMATVCGVGIIVPLDKELPANEILNLLKRSDAKCIVYSNRKRELINSIKSELPKDMIYINMNKTEEDKEALDFDTLIKDGKELLDTGSDRYINKEIDREEFKILLFTSGTTGDAKGVMLSHKNLCANIYACYKLVPKIGEYTYLSVLPMHHTYEFSLVYLLGTSNGSTIGICEGLKYIVKNLQEIKPDLICVVPALVEKINYSIEKKIKETGKEKLIKTAGKVTGALSKIGFDLRRSVFKQIHETFGGNLKFIFCGAAPIDKDVILQMESYGFEVYQGYGVTECSPLIAGSTSSNRIAGTIGGSVEGVEVRIDLSNTPDENSNVGEIITKGDNIMIGYYENEKETKKALQKGWFYTGDLGYFDLQGNLIITGRAKNVIVTSNGKNIYPEELENLVNKIDLVAESMVYGLPVSDTSKDVVVSCMVTLDNEYIESKYGANRPEDDKLKEFIWEEIKKINRTLVSYKAIKNLEIKKDEFTKTTTMKIKRFVELDKKNIKSKK